MEARKGCSYPTSLLVFDHPPWQGPLLNISVHVPPHGNSVGKYIGRALDSSYSPPLRVPWAHPGISERCLFASNVLVTFPRVPSLSVDFLDCLWGTTLSLFEYGTAQREKGAP